MRRTTIKHVIGIRISACGDYEISQRGRLVTAASRYEMATDYLLPWATRGPAHTDSWFTSVRAAPEGRKSTSRAVGLRETTAIH